MHIAISAQSLSIDMRDDNDVLIAETCMAGFTFAYETYISARTRMQVHARSFFVFHDEISVSKMKEVLMGHTAYPTFVVTDDDFYKGIEVNDGDRFKLTMDTDPDDGSEMTVQMVDTKLFLNMKVFIRMSKFLQQGLSKMTP
jgi:hypothetical protein